MSLYKPKIYVFSTSAYSIKSQAKLLASANNWELVQGQFKPYKIAGISIILGNPCNQFNRLIQSLSHTRQIWYLTTEGPVRDPILVRLQKDLKPYTIAVSNFAKCKLEESGVYVDDIFHHGIQFYNTTINPNRDIRYLYIAGYLERKYPPYIDPLLRFIHKKLALVTTGNNPWLRKYFPKILRYSIYDMPRNRATCYDDCIVDLYRRSQFYTNLSDTEGFGLTPLEASSFGVIPVLPKHPVFLEIFSGSGRECPIWIELTGRIRHYHFAPILIEDYEYDVMDYISKLRKAKWDYNRAKLCQEFANTFYYKERYKKFEKFI